MGCEDSRKPAEAAKSRKTVAHHSTGSAFRGAAAGGSNPARRRQAANQKPALRWGACPASAARPNPPEPTWVCSPTRVEKPKGTPGTGGARGGRACFLERVRRFQSGSELGRYGEWTAGQRGGGGSLRAETLNLFHSVLCLA